MIKLKSQWELERPFNLLAWGHWFAFGNLLMALVLSFFYISASPLPTSFVGWFYLANNWVSHFAFLAIACFILTIFPIVTLFPYKRHIRGVSALVASILQFLLLLDVLAYRSLGYHLSASSIYQLRQVEDVYLAYMGDGYWFFLLGVFVLIIAYQATISNFTWKRIQQLQNLQFKNAIARFLVATFVVSHLTHLWADATLNSDVAKQSNLFPLSYPLTAKSLLAEYHLIDLEEYESSKAERILINPASYEVMEPSAVSCELDNLPELTVSLVDIEHQEAVLTWLSSNNLAFQKTSNLLLSSDMNTNMFNFTTGLPGLYQGLEGSDKVDINKQLGQNKIKIEVHHGAYQVPEDISAKNAKVFVFYGANNNKLFYRTNAALVGFNTIEDKELAILPQNIIASYLTDSLNCAEYVTNNLIDKGFNQTSTESIFTNFNQGYFSIVYKDKSMLFQNGSLLRNDSFSSNDQVSDNLDLFVVEKAIEQITQKRKQIATERPSLF